MNNPVPVKKISELLSEPRPDSTADFFSIGFAVIAGWIVGDLWWSLHRLYFVKVYWEVVGSHYADFPYIGFDWAFMLINLEFALLQGATVGITTAFFARRRPYLSSIGALALVFGLKDCCFSFIGVWLIWAFAFRQPGFSFGAGSWLPPNMQWQALFAFVYLGSLFCGAFAAQLIKRHRGAKNH